MPVQVVQVNGDKEGWAMLAKRWQMASSVVVISLAVFAWSRSPLTGSAANSVARSHSARSDGADTAQPSEGGIASSRGANGSDAALQRDLDRERSRSASGGGRGRARGAPLESSGGAAIGAPVKIPAFTIKGALFFEQRQFVTDTIIEACGDGTQCVDIALVVRDAAADGDPNSNGAEPCEVLATPPAQTVPRGASITFTIAAPCGADGSPTGGGSDGSQPAGEADTAKRDQQQGSGGDANSGDAAQEQQESTDGENPQLPVDASEGG